MSSRVAESVVEEVFKADESAAYFIHNHCKIYDATERKWIPFLLWKEQFQTLLVFLGAQLVVILKARQLGQTWMALCYALWLMLFRASATVLLFSRRDDESLEMLKRMRGIYKQLPNHFKCKECHTCTDSGHTWELANGSVAHAFPTNAGDSYTATLVIVDEADIIPNLGDLMRAVKPTIDGGGQMILISRADKGRPNSTFKNIYRGAKAGLTKWKHVFLPWNVRPGRTLEWYQEQMADIYARTGSYDDLYEQYPSTDEEALQARTLDRRLSSLFLQFCYVEKKPFVVGVDDLSNTSIPNIPGFTIYTLPSLRKKYRIGADPAEGNPTSHDSSLHVVDLSSGEEVARLTGKIEISVFAHLIKMIAEYYNNAAVLVERNNHGHAVLLWLAEFSNLRLLSGDALAGLKGKNREGKRPKPGWLDSPRGKSILYDSLAEGLREGNCVIHSYSTFVQLSSIESASLRAPEGEPDDEADSFALAQLARQFKITSGWAGLTSDES